MEKEKEKGAVGVLILGIQDPPPITVDWFTISEATHTPTVAIRLRQICFEDSELIERGEEERERARRERKLLAGVLDCNGWTCYQET